jgi:gamma-glutamyltranspeptidase / glutathione hydrolase
MITLRPRRRLILPVTLLLALVACMHAPPPAAPVPSASGGGAIATAETDATQTGLAILREGGNAADAAVAAALTLAVVHPQAGNLGGGGFAVVRRGTETAALDFRETAPAAATRDMYLEPDGRPRPDASTIGPLAAGVPGSPSGLHALQRRFGRLPWPRVVQPALLLARDGFIVSARLHEAIDWERDGLARYPETASLWLPGGAPPPTGSRMRLPELARTLALYAQHGPEAITRGRVAEAIESSSRAHGGVLTAADLASYRPVWREPLHFQAYGWSFASMPLPSSGGFIVGQTLLMLQRLGWSDAPPAGAERAHLLVETWRRAYADRFILGGPESSEATADQLLDPAWIALRAASIDPDRATPSSQVGSWPAGLRSEPADTTHLSVIDGDGMMVALTTTLNGWFGCYLQVPGAGFLLNNEMDDFTTAPGRPNMFGLMQGEANAVAPGRRMLSSMSPTLAWRGAEAIVAGSPGGSRIPTATVQVLLDLIVDRMPLEEAVRRPRFHHQWLPDEIRYEEGAFTAAVRDELERRGHRLKVSDWRIGEVEVARRLPDGTLEAAADPRGPGAAATIAPASRPRDPEAKPLSSGSD